MKKTIESINQILAEWDPIGVGEDIATDEYKGYIPLILESSENKHKLMNCLEDVLINKIGIDYDRKNKKHIGDLERICNKIIQITANHDIGRE